jgi:pimeloyl-ACP methyl ester carboxylesterase
MRAREPEQSGYVERGGVRVAYEVFGCAGPAVIFLPSWQILHSRQWKLQAPYLARHMRVITYDARGNGRSDRPGEAERYAHREIVADAIAVLDAVGVGEAVFVGTSMGALYGLQAAAWYPERVRGVVAIGSVGSLRGPGGAGASPFYDVGAAGSVAAFCAERGLPDYRAFVEYFMGAAITEPHRTKPVEDAVGWGLSTTPEVLALTVAAREGVTKEAFEDVCRAVRCPVLVVHGDEDGIIPYEHGVALAELLGVGLVTLEGGGHLPSLGDPVRCNLLIREFVEGLRPARQPPRRWSRALRRRRRALVVSSPIGLGHARRDVAIVRELRALHPDLEVDWLAQHPVTAVLAEHGEQRAPGVGPAGRGIGARRVRGGRARPARLPGLPAHGRDPGGQLHGLPRPRGRGAVRPRRRATRRGTSTTSCTRTRSSSAARSPGSPTSSGGCRCPTAARPRSRSPPTTTPR